MKINQILELYNQRTAKACNQIPNDELLLEILIRRANRIAEKRKEARKRRKKAIQLNNHRT